MAALTEYQRQAKRRIKKALKKRYSADFKARALAERLVTALTDVEAANTRVTAVNALYGTTFSGRTTFTSALHTAGLAATVTTALAGSIAGAPAQEYTTPVANANSGQVLATDPDVD
jgi:hypothetical protein